MFNSMVINAEIHRQNLLEEAENARLVAQAQDGQETSIRLHLPALFTRRKAPVSQPNSLPPLNAAPCAEA